VNVSHDWGYPCNRSHPGSARPPWDPESTAHAPSFPDRERCRGPPGRTRPTCGAPVKWIPPKSRTTPDPD